MLYPFYILPGVQNIKNKPIQYNTVVRMSNIYRIYPTLWEGQGCATGQTVYAVDRAPPTPSASGFPTACSARPRADPASTWDSPTFQRLLPPPGGVGGSSGYSWGCALQAVTWSSLPAWLSYVQGLGYTLSENTSLAKLKPYGDLYVVGP